MFQKSKINEPIDPRSGAKSKSSAPGVRAPERPPLSERPAPPAPNASPSAPSIIAADLRVIGNLVTDGDLQIEGTVDGDIHASTLIVGSSAQVNGEIRSNDVTVNGAVTGKIRGRKVRLTEKARVNGDIVHSSIAMEEGAHFEGSIHRAEDPLKDGAAPTSASPSVQSGTSRVMDLTEQAKPGGGKPS